MDAKSYEKVGKRLNLKNNRESRNLMLDDAVDNIVTTLDADGHTGKLGARDGLLRGKPQTYKGFFVQLFGAVRYSSDLDVYGTLYWYGFAKSTEKRLVGGKPYTIEFDTDTINKLGYATERECGKVLFNLIDKFK